MQDVITRTPDQHCPYCNHLVDAHSGAFERDATPSKGDITVCLYCYGIIVYDDNFLMRKPTTDEFDELRKDKELWLSVSKVRMAAMEVHKNIKGSN